MKAIRYILKFEAMKKQYIFLILMLTMTSVKTMWAQQLPLFSQYLFNGFLINPAYAGLDGYSAVNLTAREQWVGIPNSPKTYIVSYQTRLLGRSFISKGASARKKMMSRYTTGRVGIGGLIFNDKNGLINRTGAQATYAYHIKLEKGEYISMAVSGSIYQFSIDRAKIQLETSSDKLVDNTMLNMIIPDMGVGAVYSSNTFYAGLSVDQLLQSYLKLGGNKVDQQYRLYRQYYITSGYHYEIDKATALEPSCLVKVISPSNYQVDLTAKVIFSYDYWAGISFRTGSAIIIQGGVAVDRFHFGYAADFSLNHMGNHGYGTHEIMVAYRFGDNPNRLRWLNR
jgi:type IX secretion system PorP/SprF family membrane protein